MHPRRVAAGHDLPGDRQQVVGEGDDVVGIPAYPATDVQQDLGKVDEHARDLVGDRLGGVVVARIEAEQFLPRDAVAEVELARPHRAALAADPEELRLHGVEVVLRRERLLKDRIERLGEPLPRRQPVGGGVLEAIRHPDVRHAGRAERPAHRGPNLPRPPAVLDPELPDALVGMRERETVGSLGMGEAGRVEVEPHAAALRPGDPVRKVTRLDLVAIDLLSAELAVEGVQVEPVLSRDDRQGRVEVGAEFVGGAGAAGIVAGDGQAAADHAPLVLEATDVVPLPAVERHGNLREGRAGLLGIHAERLVTFAAKFVGGVDLLGSGHAAMTSMAWRVAEKGPTAPVH